MEKSMLKGSSRLLSSDVIASFSTVCVENLEYYGISRIENGKQVIVYRASGLYNIWRDAVLANNLAITINKSGGDKSKSALSIESIFKNFCTIFPDYEFPAFMNTVMSNISSLKNYLTNHKVMMAFDRYPEPGLLSYIFPHVLEWYNDGKKKALEVEFYKETTQKAEEKVIALQNVGTVVQSNSQVKKQELNSAGFTYLGGKKYSPTGKLENTYEEDLAFSIQNADIIAAEQTKEILKSKAVDYEESMRRVESLLGKA